MLETAEDIFETVTIKQSKRKFRTEWTESFTWLTKKSGSAFCQACDKSLINHLTHLRRHSTCASHIENLETKKACRPLSKKFKREMSTEKSNESSTESENTMDSKATDKSMGFETLSVKTPKPFVTHIELNRPERFNAFSHQMWLDIKKCFDNLATDPDCRVIVLSGSGKHFTAGIDLIGFIEKGKEMAKLDDVARKAALLEVMIKEYQDAITSLELCPKPVICAIHSACVGAGVDLVTAADIRYCSKDAFFQVKEVDVGLAADVGTLQRLPKAVSSQSLARELCFTARRLLSEEALSCGLVNRTFPDRAAVIAGALEVAESIAEKSPVALQATKQNIIYSLSRPNQDGLDHIRLINKLNLQSDDFANAATAGVMKEKPTFSKL